MTLVSFWGRGLNVSAGCLESSARAILGCVAEASGPLWLRAGFAFQKNSDAAWSACSALVGWAELFLALSFAKIISFCPEVSCGTK